MTLDLDAIVERAKESLTHTWAGGEIPVGPSIPGAYQDAVRAEKGLARDVLALAEEVRLWRDEACSLSRMFNEPLSAEAQASLSREPAEEAT